MKTRKMSKLFLLMILVVGTSVVCNAQNWTLKQCVDTALINNLNIKQSINSIELSKVQLIQSKENLFPTLNGNASQTYNSSNFMSDGQGKSEDAWSNNFSLTSSVVLFNGFQNLNTIKQNQLDCEVAKYDLEDRKNEITLNIIQVFLQVLFNEEQLKNAINVVTASKAQLEKTESFVKVGKKSENDLLAIKSQLAADKLTLVNAEGQLKNAKLNLQQLINIPVTSTFSIDFQLEKDPLYGVVTDVEEIYRLALNNQPNIKSYQLKSQSASYAIKIAKGSLYPRLSLNGNLATNYSSLAKQSEISYINSIQNIGYLQSNPSEIVLGNVSSPVYSNSKYNFANQIKNNLGASLSLSLSIPIFNGHVVKNNIKIQQINLYNSLLNEEIVKNDLRKKIEQAYIDVENAISKYQATKEQLDASFASYQNMTYKFENGMLSTTDLLQEKNKYTKAMSESIQAKYQLIYNLKILDYYKSSSLMFN